MKLKEILNVSKNSKNNQLVWNPKKRKIKELGLTEMDLLNMEISKNEK